MAAERRRGEVLNAGFIGKAEDIARVAIFLASTESRYIIGQTILCDGGQTIILPGTPDFRAPVQERYGTGYVPGRM